ncbi:Cyanovirin-N, partial [Trichoderma asperelloides]
MAFSQSAQDFRLDGSLLVATIATETGDWVESVLDINEYIGNNDGMFEFGGSGIFDSVDVESWRLEGPLLITALYRLDGSLAEEQFINLDDYIANDNGVLVFNY